jgi:hypothetical protein
MAEAFKELGFSSYITINSITKCISNSFMTESLLYIHSINNRTDGYKQKWLNLLYRRESDRFLNLTFKHKLKGLGNISRSFEWQLKKAPRLAQIITLICRVSEKECTHFKHFCLQNKQLGHYSFYHMKQLIRRFSPTFLHSTALWPELLWCLHNVHPVFNALLAQCPSDIQCPVCTVPIQYSMPWKCCHTFEVWFLPQNWGHIFFFKSCKQVTCGW